jgi:hypothetical protein
VFSGDGLRNNEIFAGTLFIHQLEEDEEDKLGDLGDFKCHYCLALKYRHETSPSMCCNKGKVVLPAFPEPPAELKQLWFDDSARARLFRQHARSVNNAVNLSSTVVNERTHKTGTSSVVMLGKMTQLIGSLEPSGGQRAMFAQLYTVDPSVEATTRVGNFYMPDSLSRKQKDMLTKIMWEVVQVMKRDNPLVEDFSMACERWGAAGVQEGRLVISAKARPAGEHERRYNLQVSQHPIF